MKLTRQQRLGLVLLGVLMALAAVLLALTRPAPPSGTAVELEPVDKIETASIKKTKSKRQKQPTEKPQKPPRDFLGEDVPQEKDGTPR